MCNVSMSVIERQNTTYEQENPVWLKRLIFRELVFLNTLQKTFILTLAKFLAQIF